MTNVLFVILNNRNHRAHVCITFVFEHLLERVYGKNT